MEKLCKVRTRLNHKGNFNTIYNDKLPYNFFLEFLTLKMKSENIRKLGNSKKKNRKGQNTY